MRILDRYLMKDFVLAVLYCLALFFVLFVVIDIFNNMDEFLRHKVPLRLVLSYYAYSGPSILVQIIPVAVLVSVLYVLGSLSRHNEIIALKASGISGLHILAPYLFAGFLISFSTLLLNETLVPRSAVTSSAILEGLIREGRKNFDERALKNVTLYGKGNRIIFAREFEVSKQTLHDVVIFEDNPRLVYQTKITAKNARYSDGQWTCDEATSYRMSRKDNELIGEPMFSPTLNIALDEKPEDFIKSTSQIDFMTTKQLREYMEHLHGISKKMLQKLLVDFHYKLAFPFVSFVVILIGAPLAMRTERSGMLRGIGASVAIVAIYYGIGSFFLAMGKGGVFPPFLAAWLGNLLFLAIGIYLIKNTS